MPTPAVLGRSTRKTLAAALLAVPLGLFSAPGLASGPSFTLIQPAAGNSLSYASSVADDGTVAGWSESNDAVWDTIAPSYTWTEVGGRTDFVPPNTFGYGRPILTRDGKSLAVSGSWTVYNSFNGNYTSGSYAYRRNPDGSFTSLPGRGGISYRQPTGISGDGQVIVGYDGSFGQNRSWIWDHGVTTGMGIPGQPDVYTANGISGDGSTIVGTKGYTSYRGFVCRANGSYQLLPGISPTSDTTAEGVNADGSIIVGFDDSRPAVWRNMVPSLLGVPSGFTRGYSTGVSDAGDLIVGIASGSQTLPSQGFVWTPTTGIMTGADFARSIGLDVPPTWYIGQLHVSANGQFICGAVNSTDGSVRGTAFRISIPAPATFAAFAAGVASFRKRR